MILLLALGTASPLHVTHSRGVGVVYEFIKLTTIPVVDSEIYSGANVFGSSDNLDAL